MGYSKETLKHIARNVDVMDFVNKGIMLQNKDVSYLDEILMRDGKLIPVSYAKIQEVSKEDIRIFCVKKGIYCIPTTELIEFLREEINGRKAIEIGSGNGAIGRTLGITMTDSFIQLSHDVKDAYDMFGQAKVPYGDDVQRYEASDALRRFKPEVVVAAWVTHKYNMRNHMAKGFSFGVDENKILEKVKRYIFIGSQSVHSGKPIHSVSKREVRAPWLVSRSQFDDEVIWIWEK
jgi:hypothetical protein